MAKAFIKSISKHIFEEFKGPLAVDELRTSFKDAIQNLTKKKLKNELEENFDSYLELLERRLSELCNTQVPEPVVSVEDSLEVLTKSDLHLEARKDVGEPGKQFNPLVYNLTKPIKLPKKTQMEAFSTEKKTMIYCGFLKNAYDRKDVSDEKIQQVVKQLSTVIASENQEKDSQCFDWLPLISLLWKLTIGCRPLAVVRFLKMLYMNCEGDVNHCLEKAKPNRAGKLAEVLKNIIGRCSSMIRRKRMTPYQRSRYCHTVAALCSFYVDLCCVHSSKVLKKKQYGRDVCGFVCYVLQEWPEHLIEVSLQLSKMEESTSAVVLPLVIKCLASKPSMNDHEHYLKYLLLARKVNENIGTRDERLQECWMEVKKVPASLPFMSWLEEQCPETMEHLPKEDKKFKRTSITHFLLMDADEELISLLYALLSSADHPKDDEDENVEALELTEDTAQVVGEEAISAGNVFYIDTAGSSNAKELSTEQSKSHKKPIVLKSIEELEKIVGTGVLDDGSQSPQTFVLDPELITQRVQGSDSQRFFQSEIVSITSIESVGSDLQDEFGEFYVSDDPSSKTESDVESQTGIPSKPDKEQVVENDPGLKIDLKSMVKKGNDILALDAFDESENQNNSTASSLTSEDVHQVKSVVRKVSPKKKKQQEREMSLKKKVSPVKMGKERENTDSDSASVASSSVVLCEDSEDDMGQLKMEDDDLPSESVHESSVEHVEVEIVSNQTKSTVSNSMTDEETSIRGSPRKKKETIKSLSASNMDRDDVESSLASTSSEIRRYPKKPRKLDTSTSVDDITVPSYATATEEDTVVIHDSDSEYETAVDETQVLSSTVVLCQDKSVDKSEKSVDELEDEIIKDTPMVNEKPRGSDKKSLPSQKLLEVGIKKNILVQSCVQELHPDTTIDEVFQSLPSAKNITVLKSPKQNSSEKTAERKSSNENWQQANEVNKADKNLRSKSTEEIYEIVGEIKEKLKSPKTKSEVHNNAKEETMFTDESIESERAEEEMHVNEESKEEKSEKADDKPPRKSDSKTPKKSDSKTPKKSDSNSPKKSDSKIQNIFDSKTPNKSDSKTPDKSDKTPDKSDGKTHKTSDSKTPNKSDSKTPDKCDSKIQNKSDSKTPDKSEGKTPKTSDSKTPDKSDGKTPNKTDSKTPKKSDSKTPKKSDSKTPKKSDIEDFETIDEPLRHRDSSPMEQKLWKSSRSKVTDSPQSQASGTSENKSDSKIFLRKTPRKSDLQSSSTDVTKDGMSVPFENEDFPENDDDFVYRKRQPARKTPKKSDSERNENICAEIPTAGVSSPLKSERKSPKKLEDDVIHRGSTRKTPRKSDTDINEKNVTAEKMEMESAVDARFVCNDKNEKSRDSSYVDEIVIQNDSGSETANTGKEESTLLKSRDIDKKVEYVPSSQKKMKGPAITALVADSDSDSEHKFLPDISKYVKSPMQASKTFEKHPKSDITPSKLSSLVRSPKLLSPEIGKAKIPESKTKPVSKPANEKEEETKHNDIDNEKIPEEEKESPPKRPRRSLRPRAKESDNESDVPDSRQTPVTRADAKGTPARGKTPKKTEIVKGIDSDTTDQSEGRIGVSTRRRSVAPMKMTVIKERPADETAVDKVAPLPVVSTPDRRPATRKLSASTSKKAVPKVEAIRGTRKRRLSGEMSDQANSTDSEVSFPEVKKVPAKTEKAPSKRLSTPAGSSSGLNQSTSSTGSRYSLRKK